MRTRTSRLVRSIGSGVAAAALVVACTASPATALGAVGDTETFKTIVAGVNQTNGELNNSCKLEAGIEISVKDSQGQISINSAIQTDGVRSHEYITSSVGDGSGHMTTVNNALKDMVTGEAFYENGIYTSNLSSGGLKGMRVWGLLGTLGGSNESWYQSVTPPAALGSLEPAFICQTFQSTYRTLVASIQNMASLPDTDVVFTVQPDQVHPGRTFYFISQSGGPVASEVEVYINELGSATYIVATVRTIDEEFRTAIGFNAIGDAVVVPPLPQERIFTVGEMNRAVAKFTVPKVRTLAVSIQKAAERAAKLAKGSAKNKVTAALIRSKAKTIVTSKSGVISRTYTGGVRLQARKNGITTFYCVTASGSKAKIDFC